MNKSNEIRSKLTDSLELDLVGPSEKLIEKHIKNKKEHEAEQLKEEILIEAPAVGIKLVS